MSNESVPVSNTVRIIGMTCGHCVAAVTEELGAIDGVTGVEVDLEAGTATITSTAPVERPVVAAAVDEAGFELAP